MRALLLSCALAALAACGSSSSQPQPAAPAPSSPAASETPAATGRAVSDCKECGAGETCVEQIMMTGPKRSCVATPTSCPGGAASCDCMGSACQDPYTTCNMREAVLTCSCINC